LTGSLDTLIPLVAVLVNFFLVGVAGWQALGQLTCILGAFSVIYFGYGISHSKLNSQ